MEKFKLKIKVKIERIRKLKKMGKEIMGWPRRRGPHVLLKFIFYFFFSLPPELARGDFGFFEGIFPGIPPVGGGFQRQTGWARGREIGCPGSLCVSPAGCPGFVGDCAVSEEVELLQ